MTTTQALQATRDLVLTATTAAIDNRDPSAVDRYFSPDYIEHGQSAADGPEGLRAFIEALTDDFGYERLRVLAEGDLVVVHGLYHGFGPAPLVAFDIWRVADGQVVEHWDSLAEWTQDTASGRTQVDGANEVTAPEAGAASKAVVTEFIDKVLIGGDRSVVSDYVSERTYAEHAAEVADGLAGLEAADHKRAEAGNPRVYTTVHQVIAEGDFVFTRAEGTLDGPVAHNDLWRVADGKIVEHWEVREPILDEHLHNNGAF